MEFRLEIPVRICTRVLGNMKNKNKGCHTCRVRKFRILLLQENKNSCVSKEEGKANLWISLYKLFYIT